MTELSVCVVTPSFNQGAFIERTIRSVLDQGLEDLDYLIVDGGSSDETLEILRRYDGPLRFVSEPDDGQAAAVNKGFARTHGEIIGWLNSDDVYYPGALLAVCDFFARHPEIDVVYGNADHIDEHGRVLSHYYCEPWDPERLADVCILCQPAVFFRRRVVEQCGALDATLQYCMDYEYWLRLARRGMRFAYLEKSLAGSRLYATNKTLGHSREVHVEINHMLRRVLGTVPDRWLSNWAHARLRQRGLDREDHPVRFSITVSLLTWLAALRWNGRIRKSQWRTTWGWIRGGVRQRREAGDGQRKMRIGFDVSQTGSQRAGCGAVAESLARALAEIDSENQYILYPTFGDRFQDAGGPQRTLRLEQPNFQRGLAHPSLDAARELWRHPPPDHEARLGSPDVVHSHNFFCPTTLEHARVIYTLHDLAFLLHPQWTSEQNRQICFDGVFEAALHADMIVANSEATRRDFSAAFPHYPAERIRVTHWASRFTDRSPVARPAGLAVLPPEGFFLTVGTLEPRKNHRRLLRAYAAYARQDEQPLPLVLAGGKGWLMQDFDREVESLGLGKLLRPVGYVDDTELQWLYQNCFAFVYPSLFEGFGLPPREALSQGAAVITSRVASLPEVVGDAALLVDPTDEAEIEQAMLRLQRDDELYHRLRRLGPEQAARFSWEKTARQVLEAYRQALAMDKYAPPRRRASQSPTADSPSAVPPDAAAVAGHSRVVEGLRRELAAVRADQQAKEELIEKISAELPAAQADQRAKEELIRRISAELTAVRADQQAKEELIQRISAELAEVRADQQAKEEVIQRLAGERDVD